MHFAIILKFCAIYKFSCAFCSNKNNASTTVRREGYRLYCTARMGLLPSIPMNAIKSYRVLRQLTQAQFAQIVGVTSGMVSHWETGRCEISPEQALNIEVKTRGDLTRVRLRPDIFGESPPKYAAA